MWNAGGKDKGLSSFSPTFSIFPVRGIYKPKACNSQSRTRRAEIRGDDLYETDPPSEDAPSYAVIKIN